MNNTQACSWDLRVPDKNGIYLNTTYENMQYSRKGSEVLGNEMGITSADKFAHRIQDVWTSRTLGWIDGPPLNESCAPTGDRCSMGLVCKNHTCQVLSATVSDLPGDAAPPRLTDEESALPSNIGSICDPSEDIPCSNGIPCVQQGQKYFCVPQNDFRAPFFTSGQEFNIPGVSKSESSSLRLWEY